MVKWTFIGSFDVAFGVTTVPLIRLTGILMLILPAGSTRLFQTSNFGGSPTAIQLSDDPFQNFVDDEVTNL